jgi:hypothetical protein
MFPSLRDILRSDVDDGTSDSFGRSDDDIVVLRDLECVQGAFGGGLVEDSVIDRIGYRVVDQFTKDQTVYDGNRGKRVTISVKHESRGGKKNKPERTSTFIEQLHGIRRNRKKLSNIRIPCQNLSSRRTPRISFSPQPKPANPYPHLQH